MTQALQTNRPSPLPDIGDIIFILIMQLLVFAVPHFEFGDGSTGWHLVTGQFILSQHAIPRADIVSYTFPGAPWVAYEWLSDLLMAAIVKIAGLNGLAVAVAAIIGLLFLLLYRRCRQGDCHFLLVLPLIMCGALAASVHWLARPHLFTFLGVYLFSTRLESYHRGQISKRKLVLTLAATMLLWVNLHPAFLLGLVLVSIYIAGESATAIFLSPGSQRDEALSRGKTMIAAAVVSVLATLANPYGPRLYGYILQYLRGHQVLATTIEFQPPHFGGGLQPNCLEIVFLACLTGLALRGGRCSLPQFLSFVVFGHLALSAVRSVPVFVIIALPFAADLLAGARVVPEDQAAGWWRKLSGRWSKLGDEFGKNERRCSLHLLPIAFVVFLFAIAVYGANGGTQTLIDSGFDPEHMPTKTLEYIKANHLSALHGFNYDNWGGYIRYQLGIPVFIDDRADFYGETFYLEYARASTVQPGWADVLKKYNIQWVLFPADSRLAARLKEDSGWKVAAEDPASYLFVRAQ